MADDKGAWLIRLAPLKAGGPWPMTVAGKSSIEIKEVYVGDVWVCSGQSNMAFPVKGTSTEAEAALEVTPNLRFAYGNGARVWGAAKRQYTGIQPARVITLVKRSRIILKYRSALSRRHGGGGGRDRESPIGFPRACSANLVFRQSRAEATPASGNLQPFGIKGVIWYREKIVFLMPATGSCSRGCSRLINSWRKDWGQGDFPFLWVQLPRTGVKDDWPNPYGKLDAFANGASRGAITSQHRNGGVFRRFKWRHSSSQ